MLPILETFGEGDYVRRFVVPQMVFGYIIVEKRTAIRTVED